MTLEDNLEHGSILDAKTLIGLVESTFNNIKIKSIKLSDACTLNLEYISTDEDKFLSLHQQVLLKALILNAIPTATEDSYSSSFLNGVFSATLKLNIPLTLEAL